MHKTDARVLRRRGYSLRQLSDKFGISKSTASLWTNDVELSQVGIDRVNANKKLHRAMAHRVLHERKLNRLAKADVAAGKLFAEVNISKSLGLAILAALYQCEGSKDDLSIRFTNSDPAIIKLFLKTLRSSFEIDEKQLHARVHIHDYHDEAEISEFWSTVSGIPLSQFYKPFRKKSEHKFKKEGYKGCIHISYYDSHLARTLMSFAKKLNSLYI